MSGTAVAPSPYTMVVNGEQMTRGRVLCSRCSQPHPIYAWDEARSPVSYDAGRLSGRRTSDRCGSCIVQDFVSKLPYVDHVITSDHDVVAEQRDSFANRGDAIGVSMAAAMSGLLGKLGPDRRLFPLGRVSVSRSVARLGVAAGDVREFVLRHARGDFGLNGEHEKIKIGEVDEFYPMANGRGPSNCVAIQRKSGLVVSRYRAEGTLSKPEDEVQVLTFIADPGKPSRTMVLTSPGDVPKAI